MWVKKDSQGFGKTRKKNLVAERQDHDLNYDFRDIDFIDLS